jgi:hypothetical protein
MSLIKTNAIQTTGGKPILNSTGSILAVYYTQTSNVQTVTSQTPVAISGLSLTVVPSSSSSKFLITASTMFGGNGTYSNNRIHIVRNGSTSLIEMACYEVDYANQAQVDKTTVSALDSPATTSSVTYDIYAVCSNNSTGIFFNRHATGVTNTIYGMTATAVNTDNGGGHSWMRVMEVSG